MASKCCILLDFLSTALVRSDSHGWQRDSGNVYFMHVEVDKLTEVAIHSAGSRMANGHDVVISARRLLHLGLTVCWTCG